MYTCMVNFVPTWKTYWQLAGPAHPINYGGGGGRTPTTSSVITFNQSISLFIEAMGFFNK